MKDNIEILNYDFVNKVLDNLSNHLNVKNDRQLAMKLDIIPSTLFNNRKRGILPYEKILTYALKNNISLDKLFNQNSYNNENNDKLIKPTSQFSLTEIKLITNEIESIRVPIKISDVNNYRAYLDDKKIYIIDTANNAFKNKNIYLIKNNQNFFVVSIYLEFDSTYTIKDENDIELISKLSKNDFENIEILGKVDFVLTRETYL